MDAKSRTVAGLPRDDGEGQLRAAVALRAARLRASRRAAHVLPRDSRFAPLQVSPCLLRPVPLIYSRKRTPFPHGWSSRCRNDVAATGDNGITHSAVPLHPMWHTVDISM